MHVVRGFTDEDVIRAGSVSPEEDLEIIKTELDLADYEMEEKSKGKKGDANPDLPLFKKKPILVVLNIDEETLKDAEQVEKNYAEEMGLEKDQIIAICAKTEAELAGLGDEDAKAYLAELGITQSGLERLIKKAFATLGLITFLTAGVKEVRAWTLRAGTDALRASGIIHTDFMNKFIKAEVVSFEDFVECGGPASPGERASLAESKRASRGGWKAAREAGKARLEGRDYIVKDGDVIEFKIGS